MRKITYLLLLFLTSLVSEAIIVERGTKLHPGTAINSAEVTSGYYLIKSKSTTFASTPFLVANGGSLSLAADAGLGTTNAGLWKIAFVRSATDGNTQSSQYLVLNVSTSTYFTQGADVPLRSDRYKYWFNKTGENTYQFGLSNSNSGLNWNAVGAYLDGTTIKFNRGGDNSEKDFELIPVTFFETPSSVSAATKWYRILGKRDGYIAYNGGAPTTKASCTDDDLWCFVPQADGTYKIYNRTDQTKVLGAFDVPTDVDQNVTGGTFSMTEPDNAEASATTYNILPSYAEYPYMVFKINTTNSSTAFLNHDHNNNQSLRSWNHSFAIYGWGKAIDGEITGQGDQDCAYQFIEVEIQEDAKYAIVIDNENGAVSYNGTEYKNGSSFTSSATLSASDFTVKELEGYSYNITISEQDGAFTVNVTYKEKLTPSLPSGKKIFVTEYKANFLVPATDANDNEHWYVLTQVRNGESPVYDCGTNKLKRAAANTSVDGLDINGNEKYLVRFFEQGEGLYTIQFATGNFITNNLTTGNATLAGTFNIYNINDVATHIGWNKEGFTDIADNNGADKELAWWSSGKITDLNGNNDWSLYEVVFDNEKVTVTAGISLTSKELNKTFIDQYTTTWAGNKALQYPTLRGLTGYTLSNIQFNNSNNNYSLKADFHFPFPVSTATTQNPTGIESALGTSKWFVNANDIIKANNTANTFPSYALTWNIIPSFNNGTFSFKIKNVLTGKYIPAISAAQAANTVNTVVEESEAGTFYFMPCTGTGAGFSIDEAGTIFLTINADNKDQNIWTWAKSGSHRGSNLAFPTITVTDEDIKNHFNTYAAVEPLDILEGSVVVAPNEFTNTPTEINAALEPIKSIEENNITAMDLFNRSNNTQIIQNYLNVLNQYNMQAFTCKLDVKHQYNTIILPGSAAIPEGVKIYTCSETEDNGTTLVLVENTQNIGGSTPFIVESTVGNKYTFVVWDYGNRSTHTVGLLTGVLTEGGANVPANSYVLAYKKSANVQAFYQTDGTVTCPQTKCYLTAPATMASAKAFFLGHNGETTGIEDVFNGKNGETVIYNTAGQRINKLQKGINIVNGHKVLVK